MTNGGICVQTVRNSYVELAFWFISRSVWFRFRFDYEVRSWSSPNIGACCRGQLTCGFKHLQDSLPVCLSVHWRSSTDVSCLCPPGFQQETAPPEQAPVPTLHLHDLLRSSRLHGGRRRALGVLRQPAGPHSWRLGQSAIVSCFFFFSFLKISSEKKNQTIKLLL